MRLHLIPSKALEQIKISVGFAYRYLYYTVIAIKEINPL